MTACLGGGCSFCLPRVPFVNCRQFMNLVIYLFGFEGRIWDLVVSVPDHCLSFYFDKLIKFSISTWMPRIELELVRYCRCFCLSLTPYAVFLSRNYLQHIA